MPADFSEVLTNVARPVTSVILTVRVIKSFEYRVHRNLVLKDIDLTTATVADLKNLVLDTIRTQAGWKPYRTAILDTLKLYTQAHGAKTTNLIMNFDHDEWILTDEEKPLLELGFQNETEVSFFSREAYDAFKLDPKVNWE